MTMPTVHPLKIIGTEKGDVLHGVKVTDDGFQGFGEAYFTRVNPGHIKGWKKHTQMTLNLIVVMGAVKFYIEDDSGNLGLSYILGPSVNYARLTVPPGYWVAFENVCGEETLILNVASIPHAPEEAETRPLDAFVFKK